MTISAGTIQDKVSLLLQDATNIRWTYQELAGWIDSACKEMVLLKPSSLVTSQSIPCVAGSKQTLSSVVGYVQLLEVVRNMGLTGTTPGNAITSIDRKVLDVTMPGWHFGAPSPTVKHFVFDPKDPKTFYVYPPNTGTGYVEVLASKSPISIGTANTAGRLTGTLDAALDEVYENVVVDYVLYRAYSKDSEYTANAGRSQWHYQAFQSALGIKVQNEVIMAPHQQFSNQPVPQQG